MTIAVDLEVKSINKTKKTIFSNKTQVYVETFSLMCDEAYKRIKFAVL